MRFQAAGGAERPARTAVGLVLHQRHGSQVSPVPRGRRLAALAETERTVLAPSLSVHMGRRAVLAGAEGATEAEARRLELFPVGVFL